MIEVCNTSISAYSNSNTSQNDPLKSRLVADCLSSRTAQDGLWYASSDIVVMHVEIN